MVKWRERMAETEGSKITAIPKRELLAYRAALKLQIFRQIRKAFHALKVSQKDLAAKLGVDEGLLSRRLRGENDMRLETFSDLARGLERKINVVLIPIVDIPRMPRTNFEWHEIWTDAALETGGVSGGNITSLTSAKFAFPIVKVSTIPEAPQAITPVTAVHG